MIVKNLKIGFGKKSKKLNPIKVKFGLFLGH